MEGKIFVKFIVDKEGQIINPEIMKGIGYGADEEALRVVSSYKNLKELNLCLLCQFFKIVVY